MVYLTYYGEHDNPPSAEPRPGQSLIESLVAVNGSPSSSSRPAAVATAAIEINGGGTVIHVGDLNAEALLAREPADDVDASLEKIRTAGVVVVVTPVYRRTYSGLLKALFDLFEPSALAGIPAVLGATAGHGAESLCIDHGLRPLIASLDGWSVPTSVYATHSDFENGAPVEAVRERIGRALGEAELLAAAGARR
jgi:FMN reductase